MGKTYYCKKWEETDAWLSPINTDKFMAYCKICLKVVSASFLLVCFLCLKESTCETRKNLFYFTLKALFVLEIIKF